MVPMTERIPRLRVVTSLGPPQEEAVRVKIAAQDPTRRVRRDNFVTITILALLVIGLVLFLATGPLRDDPVLRRESATGGPTASPTASPTEPAPTVAPSGVPTASPTELAVLCAWMTTCAAHDDSSQCAAASNCEWDHNKISLNCGVHADLMMAMYPPAALKHVIKLERRPKTIRVWCRGTLPQV